MIDRRVEVDYDSDEISGAHDERPVRGELHVRTVAAGRARLRGGPAPSGSLEQGGIDS
jgi:hypothetical protein